MDLYINEINELVDAMTERDAAHEKVAKAYKKLGTAIGHQAAVEVAATINGANPAVAPPVKERSSRYLTEFQVRHIRALSKKGYTQADIAAEVKCSVMTVGRVLSGKSHGEVK